MNIQEYVNDVLCVPVSRSGNRLIVESIEIVLDLHSNKFYDRLEEATGKDRRVFEKTIRDAKLLGLVAMNPDTRIKMFGAAITPKNTQYIITAAEYYRRNYENKEEG